MSYDVLIGLFLDIRNLLIHIPIVAAESFWQSISTRGSLEVGTFALGPGGGGRAEPKDAGKNLRKNRMQIRSSKKISKRKYASENCEFSVKFRIK